MVKLTTAQDKVYHAGDIVPVTVSLKEFAEDLEPLNGGVKYMEFAVQYDQTVFTPVTAIFNGSEIVRNTAPAATKNNYSIGNPYIVKDELTGVHEIKFSLTSKINAALIQADAELITFQLKVNDAYNPSPASKISVNSGHSSVRGGNNTEVHLSNLRLPALNVKVNTGLRLQAASTDLFVGDEVRLGLLGKDGDVGADAAWDSTNPEVATIDKGILTAVAAGTTQITAAYGELYDSLTFTVKEPSVTGFELDPEEVTVHVGEKVPFPEAYEIYDNGNSIITTSTINLDSDTTLVALRDGSMYAVAEGTAIYNATLEGKELTPQTYTVTILPAAENGLSLSDNDFTLEAGQSRSIKAYATYTDDSKVPLELSQIRWYTSDSNIAEVDDTGTITAIAPGIATIKTLYNGYEAELNVTVTAAGDNSGGGTGPGTPTDPGTGTPTDPGTEQPSKTETGIALLPKDKYLLAAASSQSIAAYQEFSDDTTEPLSAEDVQWWSTNESVATVNEEGSVTAVAKGVSVITAKHNKFEAKIIVIVYTADTGNITAFKIAGASGSSTVPVHGTYALTASVTYADNSQKDVTQDAVWISSNPAVCTVTDGVVAGISPGTAELKLYYAGRETNYEVTVIAGSTPDESSGGNTSGGNTSGGNTTGGNTATNANTTTGTIITGSIPVTTMPVQPSTPSVTEVFNTKVLRPEAVVSKVRNLVSAATPAARFQEPADVKGNWAAKTIDIFLKLNIIKGYTDGLVKPNQAITRAEFVGILSRIFEVEGTSIVSFKDVTGSNWAKAAIGQFAAAGIINGYANGEFRPNQMITREEMVIVLSRVINLESLATDAAKGGFSDIQGAKAAVSIQQAAQAGIISGFSGGTFAPEGNATRAEALTMILNALNLNGQIKTMLDTLK
ncbi:S-layer homology domain-containing protein [Paenibacillus borealis]|uniref:S-layer homology domain-containing protein n=1 Tax=Paenibacillus borealis TaxID=160799 RepID=UPI001C54C99C|nr:S-layer homology domain-containing protein [Paenibacillus borealis]